MKKVIRCILLFLIIFITSMPLVVVCADSSDLSLGDYVNDLIEGLDLSVLEDFLKEITNNTDLKKVILQAIKGNYLSFDEIISLIFTYFKDNYQSYFGIFLSLLSLTIVYSVFTVIKPGNGKFSDIIFTACYCGIAVLIFNETTQVINGTKEIIDKLSKQSQSIFPLILTLLTSTGASASASLYNPVCILLSNGINVLINRILFPVVIAISLISVISALSEKYTLKGLNDLLCQVFKWIIGLTVTVFSIFVSVKGITASNYDLISLRVLKYAVGSGLPLIGGIAKDGVDLVLTATILLKNAIGSIAIYAIFFTLIRAVFRILIFSLLLKLLSAICSPIADNRILSLFASMAKVVSMLISLLVMVFVIYFLTMILILGTNGAIGG